MAVRDYHGEQITVHYDVERCRHIGECVRGDPLVFDPGRRPWILADADPDAEHVAEVVRRCPTGALHYTLKDGPAETPDPRTTVTVVPDGPLLVRGDLRIDLGDGTPDEGAAASTVTTETRAALCRCGSSANKPYCDGSHEEVGWTA